MGKNMTCLSRCATVLVAACVVLPSHADTVSNEPLVVTATRLAESADATLASVTVITSAQIEQSQAHDVTELLRQYAGIDLGRNGGPGQTASVFIRGANSNQTLLLIDGVKMNPATIGGAPWERIDPALIDHIEIVRGPRSALYGSEAIGGVVQIFTRRAKNGVAGNASASYGSDNTQTLSAGLHGSDGRWRGGMDASWFGTDGFPAVHGANFDSGHRNLGFNGYAGGRFHGIDIEASHWQQTGTTGYSECAQYDSVTFDCLSFAPVSQDFTNRASAMTLKAEPTSVWSTTVKLSHMEDDIAQNQADAVFADMKDFTRTRRNLIDWQNDIQAGAHHLLTAGLYASRETAASLVYGAASDVSMGDRAIYLQDTIEYGPHKLLAAIRHSQYDTFGGHESWNLAYGYQFTPATRAFASIGIAFRAPDATDLYGYGGNPDLRPETARNLEIGLAHHVDAHQTVELAIFRNNISNLIIYNDPNFFDNVPGKNENIGSARIQGIEPRYRYHGGQFEAHIEASFQDPKNEDSGRDLARRASRSLTTGLDYQIGRYRLGADWLVVGARNDSDFSTTRDAGYGLVNLTAGTKLARDWHLQARIENLLDRGYVLADGFNTQRRAAFVMLRYSPTGAAQ